MNVRGTAVQCQDRQLTAGSENAEQYGAAFHHHLWNGSGASPTVCVNRDDATPSLHRCSLCSHMHWESSCRYFMFVYSCFLVRRCVAAGVQSPVPLQQAVATGGAVALCFCSDAL